MLTRSHTISRRRARIGTSVAARRLYRVSQGNVVAGRGLVATRAICRGTEIIRLRVKTYTDVQLAVRRTADVVPNDHFALYCKETQLWFIIGDHYGTPSDVYMLNAGRRPNVHVAACEIDGSGGWELVVSTTRRVPHGDELLWSYEF